MTKDELDLVPFNELLYAVARRTETCVVLGWMLHQQGHIFFTHGNALTSLGLLVQGLDRARSAFVEAAARDEQPDIPPDA